MTVARFPSLAHWGAFTALVEDGRLVGCEPFARDPAPSDLIDAMPEMVHSPLRIARPTIRDGWREGKRRTGADTFREVSWDEALDTVSREVARVRQDFGHTSILGGSYGALRRVPRRLDHTGTTIAAPGLMESRLRALALWAR
jgi:biotin/methionine sulfoxide reductase